MSTAFPSGPVRAHRFGVGALPAPRSGLIVAAADGATVVFDPEADLLHHLDGPAAAVWSQLDGAMTLPNLASRLAASYGADQETVRRDVVDLVGVLWERGLLRGSEAPMATPTRTVEPHLDSGPLSMTLSERGLGNLALPEAPHRTHGHRALEYSFRVATNDIGFRDYIDHVLTDLARPDVDQAERYDLLDLGAKARDNRYLVLFNGTAVMATDEAHRALAVLLWHINAGVVRRSTSRWPVVHAAAAVTEGVAVLLPGPAESGKTTTVAGLVRAGFGYLTDEAVGIDVETLAAQPYPKALSIDRGSWRILSDLRPPHDERLAEQWQVPVRQIRPDAVSGPAPIRFVVCPEYHPGSTTRLEPVSRGEMLMRLADSTFQFQDNAHRNLELLALVVTNADCYRLTVSDLDQAVKLIADMVSSEELDVTEG